MADEVTVLQGRHRIETREIDLLAAVGKLEAVRMFELLGEIGSVDAAKLELRDAFEAGLTASSERLGQGGGGVRRMFAHHAW